MSRLCFSVIITTDLNFSYHSANYLNPIYKQHLTAVQIQCYRRFVFSLSKVLRVSIRVIKTVPRTSYIDFPSSVAEDVLTPPHEAMWCSPDGSFLLFTSFNDSEVRSFVHPWFSVSDNTPVESGVTFPASRSVRYPTVRAEYYTPSSFIPLITYPYQHVPTKTMRPNSCSNPT